MPDEQDAPSSRTRVRRKAERGRYDRASIDAILDEGLVAHVGFTGSDGICVLPMVYGRIGDRLYLHGAVGNAMLRAMSEGVDVCVTITLVDGLVLSRSAFHHSVNYRSLVVMGRADVVDDAEERERALRAVVEHAIAGRSDECRGPSPSELRSTRVLALPLVEASAKVRTGPPIEEDADLALPYWGGVVPIETTFGAPVPDDYVAAGVTPPRLDGRGVRTVAS
jgi:nitroimidazol reductase NimA-like FMN-containing flavoprotein (pyridoxamine 5'-phosphate oxidase superfamily)